jgi:hypothetical protein
MKSACRSSAVFEERSFDFQVHDPGNTLVPITKVTPDDGFYVHTYYDVCPFSPSGRYLAATRLPYQDRIPVLGDTADVCVIDLPEQTIRTVYTTQSWGFQTGANVHWGATDNHLYTNDVVDGKAVCCGIDLTTGATKSYANAMYSIAPDESSIIAFPFELLDITQRGYGVPPANPDKPKVLPPGASETEGIWKTDLRTNESGLLLSLADAAALVPEPAPEEGGTFYFWHTKFSRQGNRIMQVLRCMLPSGLGGRNTMVLTLDADGSNLKFMPQVPIWGAGGGHPNWHPDGEHLIRVLKIDGVNPRLCQFCADGADLRVLSEKILGGGHPTFEGQGRFIVTDHFYGSDPQLVDIQFIDMQEEKIEVLATMATLNRADELDYQPHRLDGHPAWSRDYKTVCFQAAPNGARQLYLADVSELCIRTD